MTGRPDRSLTRRRFLQAAAAAGALGACSTDGGSTSTTSGAGPTSSIATSTTSRGGDVRTRTQVAVLGGGVGGLTAAQELAERGLSVRVYERNPDLGGKARSLWVPDSASGDRMPLPGEHGFRFFPGFYRHVPDTMARVGTGGGGTVADNLVPATAVSFSRAGGLEDIVLPVAQLDTDIGGMQEIMDSLFRDVFELPEDEVRHFTHQMAVFLSSSDERRYGELEDIDWFTWVRAAESSDAYRKLLAVGATRNFVAARAEQASARTIALMLGQFFYNLMGEGAEPDRVLNGPTNLAWIDPWVDHLADLGVELRTGATVTDLVLVDGQIREAALDLGDHREVVEADWFVCALPMEVARRLWSPELRSAAPELVGLDELHTEWMNGLQVYLTEEVPVIRGHLSYTDSPWALTSISQSQFWPDHPLSGFGDGTVRDILSIDISDWDAPGIVHGKPARECTAEEIAEDAVAQIRAHLEDTGDVLLPEAAVHSWFLDPAITFPAPGETENAEPLLVNTAGSWHDRPEATTSVGNLFLASDYVRTNIDLATMEGANEAGRSAANGVLDALGSNEPRAELWPLYESPEFDGLKADDAERFARGEPHFLDTP